MGSEGRRGQRSGSPAPSQPREALKWTHRMDEAYEAAVEKLGGLEQCKPKAVLLQLQSDQPELFADVDVQRVKWKLLSHRRREQRHRAMAPQGIAPPTKWSGRLEEAYEEAVTQLGGIHSAQPKQVLERLQPEFPDLTLEIIKWHLQGQRRRERRLASRSGSTKPPLQRGEQQEEEEEEEEEQEDEEEQEGRRQQQQQAQQEQQQLAQQQQQRRPAKQQRAAKQQRQRPPRVRQRAASGAPASATATGEGTARSAADASDGEAEVAPVRPEQQAQQGQAQPFAAPLPPQLLLQQQFVQQALEQQAVQQQLLQQAVMAQQLGQLPGMPAAPFLMQQHQQLAHLPALLAGHPAAAAAFLGPLAPTGLAAGAASAGLSQPPAAVAGPSWAQHTLLAAVRTLNRARRDRIVASQLVRLLEEQRDKLQQLVPILVAAEAAQAPNSSASGDPLSQLLHSAQLLPLGQEWPSLASGNASLAPAAIRDVSPAALKRQPRAVLAAAAAFPLRSPSPAVGPHQSGGGGSMSSGESGEGHLRTCTIPNCRRCAYERRLQGAKQQQAAAAAEGGPPRPDVQQQQQQHEQQQQQVAPASLAEEPLLDFTDPALVKVLGSLLGSMPARQAAGGGPAS